MNRGFKVNSFKWENPQPVVRFQYESTREFGSGSGPQALNCQRVRELPFILSPIEEQEEIVKEVEKYFEKIDCLEQEYKKAVKFLDRLEQSTLAKAFRGEIVPQDPNDEPVSVLLERIQQQKNAQTPAKKRNPKKSPIKPNSFKTNLPTIQPINQSTD